MKTITEFPKEIFMVYQTGLPNWFTKYTLFFELNKILLKISQKPQYLGLFFIYLGFFVTKI
ncbi:hypothetical protein OBPA_03650 [Polaribacter sp. OB-PA-B3]